MLKSRPKSTFFSDRYRLLFYNVNSRALDKTNDQIFCFIFLHLNICSGYALESPRRGDSNAFPQLMFLLFSVEKYIKNSINTV